MTTGGAASEPPYLAIPQSRSGSPVLIIHSWWGLTTSFTQYADRLAGQGFVAFCADLYQGKTAATEADAHALRKARRAEPMYKTLLRNIESLRAHPASTGESVALVAFSMGGHWAVWLAQHGHVPISATVLYYAARGGYFSAATSPFLAHFANDDPFVSDNSRTTMERAIRQAGLAYTAFDYPTAAHWFAESDEAAYEHEAADLAFERTTTFLHEALTPVD